MRLGAVSTGHRWQQRVVLGVIRLSGLTPFDVIKTFMYRPEFFGRPFCDFGQLAMRGPSDWTVGERELFGALTSKLNACKF